VKVFWTDTALERTKATALHISAEDPPAARRWVVGLFQCTERLSTYPEVGRFAPELVDRAVRELIYGRYRIFYRVDREADRVIILSVQHGSQLVGEQEMAE
jgi:toxin ParE1/3/4